MLIADYYVNPVTNNNIFDCFEFKAFPDDSFNVAQMMQFYSDRVENIVEKGVNASFQHFLLFPQCFQKASFSGSWKPGIVWERVKVVLGKYLCKYHWCWLFERSESYLITWSIERSESYLITWSIVKTLNFDRGERYQVISWGRFERGLYLEWGPPHFISCFKNWFPDLF